MEKTLIVQVTLMLCVSWGTVSAQDQLKIGHVNIVEIVSAMPESDSAQITLESDSKELETMLENMQVEYNKMLHDYQENLNSYSQMIRQTKETELLELQNRIQAFQQNASQQLQQRNFQLMQPIYDKIQEAIDEVATNHGFTYILDISKGSVVFTSDNSQDINSLVKSAIGINQ